MIRDECCESRTHHPYLLEGVVILQRNDVVSDGYELEVVRGHRDITEDALLLKDMRDQGGRPRDEKYGVCVFLVLPGMSPNLVLRQIRKEAEQWVTKQNLTCYYLDPLDERPAQIHDVRGGCGQRSGLEPEHLVYAMMLHRISGV